jgi:hypothetical protein
LDEGKSPLPEVIGQEMYLFMAVTVQVEHDQSDTLKNYWYTQEQVYIPFYRNIMRQNIFFHIHIFLNFCDNKKP